MQKKCDSTIQQNMLQIQCKKMQMKSANPLQTSNCSQKNANRTCNFIANKIKKNIHFQHPSLYQTNSHNLKHSAPWSKTAATKQNHKLCIKYKCILATEDKGLWPSQATSGFSRFPPSFPTDLLCKWLHHLQCFHR